MSGTNRSYDVVTLFKYTADGLCTGNAVLEIGEQAASEMLPHYSLVSYSCILEIVYNHLNNWKVWDNVLYFALNYFYIALIVYLAKSAK